ncbi:hypothetical protein E0W68_04135 [Flavobacterium salilacus subsp. salilacus]|uniref:hypothetical protein n=1 Tax=Flavobacterium TaxID=237 RepID=UPI0010753BE5|nr:MULTISPECIES: hypothetical protein [Flavobacterium]KAF2519542.1 hypothetical protein E0W68_04135 [Flavobacterium salilacus subsp. salilacus]MBE1614560.1 hypothetical protein [Flavobacterium sp. SaA2.13]
MKNIFKSLLLLSSLMVVSCGDVEPVVYNGAESNDTFLSFSASSYTLPVRIDDTGSVEVTLNSSTVSSVDRTYQIEIVEEETDAIPETYTLPTSITIPAGKYQGFMTITGVDNNLVDTNPDKLVFRISNRTDEYTDVENITVSIVEVCPLDGDFTGDYRVNQLTAGMPINPGNVFIFEDNSIVQLQVGDSDFERYFAADIYSAAVSGLENEFRFTLTCGETSLSREIDLGIGCTEATLKILPGLSNATYVNDGSVIDITVTEDPDASCADAARQTTIRLTKVN